MSDAFKPTNRTVTTPSEVPQLATALDRALACEHARARVLTAVQKAVDAGFLTRTERDDVEHGR